MSFCPAPWRCERADQPMTSGADHGDAQRVSSDVLERGLIVSPVAVGDPRRARVESFIARRYQEAFGARLGAFLPNLLMLETADGHMRAALGYRVASSGRLFVEDYLDQPAEQCVAAALKRPVERANLVEVGNLAAEPGLGRAVVLSMTRFLAAHGYRQVLFAATGMLRSSFGRLGLTPVALAPARAERLRDQRSNWGSYYQTQPVVLCGDLEDGMRLLAALESRK